MNTQQTGDDTVTFAFIILVWIMVTLISPCNSKKTQNPIIPAIFALEHVGTHASSRRYKQRDAY